jgi:DNA-binding CsgD family transcriptional regulator
MDLESDRYEGVVEAVYETVEGLLAWREACAGIADLTGATAVWITARDRKNAQVSFSDGFETGISGNNPSISENIAVAARFDFAESFEIQLGQKNTDDSAADAASADYVSRRNIFETEELLVTLNCEFRGIAGAMPPQAARWLERLTPHLERAARLQARRFLAAADGFAELQLLDEWRLPAMLVAMNGAVLRANRAAQRLVRHTSLVRVREGMLELSEGEHRRLLDDCHGDRQLSESGSVSPFQAGQVPASRYRMLRLIAPGEAADAQDAAANVDALYVFYHLVASSRSNAALLTFYHLDSPPLVDPALLSAAFDLTPAECRVAHSIAEGRTPKEIAARLGVQHDTVRKQLQAIYQKTATNRQADLIRLLLHLPAHRVPNVHGIS